MIEYSAGASSILRNYVWELLKDNLDWEQIDGKTPVIPLADEPDMADSGKPYVVYGYAENEGTGLEEIKRGTISFRVQVSAYPQLYTTINFLSHAFESTDVATEAVNRWASTLERYHGFRFTYLCTSFVEGGEAPESEGGPVDGIVNISYRYIRNQAIPVPDAVTANGGLWT